MAVTALSAVVAKSLAVLEGCHLAKGLNIPQVVIESDSKHVISYLHDSSLSCT